MKILLENMFSYKKITKYFGKTAGVPPKFHSLGTCTCFQSHIKSLNKRDTS